MAVGRNGGGNGPDITVRLVIPGEVDLEVHLEHAGRDERQRLGRTLAQHIADPGRGCAQDTVTEEQLGFQSVYFGPLSSRVYEFRRCTVCGQVHGWLRMTS